MNLHLSICPACMLITGFSLPFSKTVSPWRPSCLSIQRWTELAFLNSFTASSLISSIIITLSASKTGSVSSSTINAPYIPLSICSVSFWCEWYQNVPASGTSKRYSNSSPGCMAFWTLLVPSITSGNLIPCQWTIVGCCRLFLTFTIMVSPFLAFNTGPGKLSLNPHALIVLLSEIFQSNSLAVSW